MSPVTRYRRVRVRLWTEPAFRRLDDAGKLVALYIVSGPQTNSIGLYRLSVAGAAEHMAMPVTQFRRRLAAVVEAFGWRYEAETGLVWLPEWPEENAPANPNICQSWRSAFNEIPDSPLKAEAVATAFAFLEAKGERFAKAFGEPITKPLREPSRNGLVNAPDPVTDWPNRIGNDDRRIANAEHTRGVVSELQRRRSLG
jgi:hypothetical protein